nr:FUSC family protein [Mycobacterium sp. QGD 101]
MTTPDIGAVMRSLLGVLAVTALALVWGSDVSAMWALGAGAVAGAIALQDSPGGRVPIVVTASLQMGAAVLLGVLTAAYSGLFIAVVALWCFGAGMQWSLGANAGRVAAAASALLVVAPPVSPTPSSVLTATAFTLAAGFVQAALIAVWPPRRWRVQRDALTRAYRSLAADARKVATDRDARVDAAPLTWLREAFVDSQATQRPRAYHGGYRLPERITATLSALRSTSGAERDDGTSQMLTAAAVFLDAMADHSHTARRDAGHALVRVDAAVAAITGPEAATAQRFSQQLHEASVLRFGQLRRPDLIGSLLSAPGVVRNQLTRTSPILRHAARLATAVAVAMVLARFGGVAHGYWVALTVLVVLRPETAHTYTRCFGRVGGIGVGIALTSGVMLLWHPGGLAAAVLAVVCLGLTYMVIGWGYVAVSVTVAAALVFILDVGGVGTSATMENRLFAAVVGGALAVLAHVLLPDHALVRLRQRAGELLKTETDYAATVVKAFVHELDRPAELLSAAWQRASRARSAFEAASGATRVDSRELRRWLRSYRASLNAITSACASLENNLSSGPSTALSQEFVAAVDDYVEVLRGAPASPAAPWTVDITQLTAANQQLRDAAALSEHDDAAPRVLVAEINTITRQLTQISAADPVSATG